MADLLTMTIEKAVTEFVVQPYQGLVDDYAHRDRTRGEVFEDKL